MAWNQTDLSFKILQNKRVTDESPTRRFFEEIGDRTLDISIDDIYASIIPTAATTVQAIANASASTFVDYLSGITLTEDIDVGGQQAYFAQFPNDPFSKEVGRLKNFIPDKYGLGYTVELFDNNDIPIPFTDNSQWIFNYKTGILTFSGSTAAFAKPFKINAFRYVGPTLGSFNPADAGKALLVNGDGSGLFYDFVSGSSVVLQTTGFSTGATMSQSAITEALSALSNSITGGTGSTLTPGTSIGSILYWDGTDWVENLSFSISSGTTGTSASATATNALAWGVDTLANSYSQTTFGSYPIEVTGQSLNTWVWTDELLKIGNGISSSTRNDALTLFKNGVLSVGRAIDVTDNLSLIEATGTTEAGLLDNDENLANVLGDLYWSNNKILDLSDVSQTTGSSTAITMSQSAITNALQSISLGGLPVGTTLNSILTWDGSQWIENLTASISTGGTATASGDTSVAFGLNTNSNSYVQTTIGANSLITSGQSLSTWVWTDELFKIGNGLDATTGRSDALIVYKNSTIEIPNAVDITNNSISQKATNSTVGPVTNRLYNICGDLYWNGQLLNNTSTPSFAPPILITSSTTLSDGSLGTIYVECSGGTVLITLPPNPEQGQRLTFKDTGNASPTNRLQITGNTGQTVEGGFIDTDDDDATLNLEYFGTNWYLIIGGPTYCNQTQLNLSPLLITASTTLNDTTTGTVYIECSGGTVAVTMPVNPQFGQKITFKDTGNASVTNRLQINANSGQIIEGGNIDTDDDLITLNLEYFNNIWYLIS